MRRKGCEKKGRMKKSLKKLSLTFALLPLGEDLLELARARRELHEPHRRRVGRGEHQHGLPFVRKGKGVTRGAHWNENVGRVPPRDLLPLCRLLGVIPDPGVGLGARDPLLLLRKRRQFLLIVLLAGNELVLFLLEVDVRGPHAARPEDAAAVREQGPGPADAKELVRDPGGDVSRVEGVELELAFNFVEWFWKKKRV